MRNENHIQTKYPSVTRKCWTDRKRKKICRSRPRHDRCAVMVRISQLRECSMHLYWDSSGPRFVGRLPFAKPEFARTSQPSPASGTAACESADDTGSQDQLPDTPGRGRHLNQCSDYRRFATDIGLVASRSYIIPSVFFFGQLDSNGNNSVRGGTTSPPINTLMGSLAVQKLGPWLRS